MTAREAVCLNESVPQLQVPQAADTYLFPRDCAFTTAVLTSSVADGASAVGFTLNTTNTLSTSGANLLVLQNATTPKWRVDKDGRTFIADGSKTAPSLARLADTDTGFYFGAGYVVFSHDSVPKFYFENLTERGFVLAYDLPLMWNNAADATTGVYDTSLYRDAASTLALRNSTNAMVFRAYRTYTDGSNYERAALQSGAGYFEVACETAGTGTDNIDLKLTPAGTGVVQFGSHSSLAAETVTGYITIKDAAGNSRKLAVVS